MNAYLMCAGVAERLRPVTEKFPKCLLPIAGSPILEAWLDAIRKSGEFETVWVNVHHCADQIEKFVDGYAERFKMDIRIIDERSKLLGTAGTLFWHADQTEDFMVAYSDTYSNGFMNGGIKKAVRNWKENPDPPLAGIVTFSIPEDGSAGAVEMDAIGNVTSFTEKSTKGLVAWAGIMLCRGKFINEIKMEDKDLARDVLPRLCGRICAIAHVDAYDIGRGLDQYADADRKIYKTGRRTS